jgi:hypothetical protein
VVSRGILGRDGGVGVARMMVGVLTPARISLASTGNLMMVAPKYRILATIAILDRLGTSLIL